MKKRIAFMLAALMVSVLASLPPASLAQPNSSLWRDISESAIPNRGQRTLTPSVYRTVSLNLPALRNLLAQAPMEGTVTAKASPVVLELPMPQGGVSRFSIVESPVMAAELSVKYPNIKTYSGQGIDDPTASVRFDLTLQGFHAMILSATSGTMFIDPYSRANKDVCISYFKRDYLAPEKAGRTGCIGVEGENSESARKIAELVAAARDRRLAVPSGTQLRTYRLSMTATGEYTAFHGGTVDSALSAIVVTVNRVDGVYEREVAVRMVLIANTDTMIYTNAATDPFTSPNPSGTMLNQNQTATDARVGTANYDIGHIVAIGDGGIAGLGVVCRAGQKARGATGRPVPVGDPFDIDYVAHEMGHQFSGNHTQNNNCNRNGSTAYEPGSASTIMGYAGICPPDLQPNSDDYFHTISFDEIVAYTTAGAGNGCPVTTATGNTPPVVNVSGSGGYTIPKSTPFVLTGAATDADGDELTYCWEEFDLGPAGAPSATSTTAPIIRSYLPASNGTRIVPRLQNLLNNTTPVGELLPAVARTLRFRLTARDNRAGGGGSDYALATPLTVSGTSGPFLVTAPNTAVSWTVGTGKLISWDVANTNIAPVSCNNVNILLSTDGGLTFVDTLAANAPNDGSVTVTVPNKATAQARVKIESVGNIFFDISNANFSIVAPPVVANDLGANAFALLTEPPVLGSPNLITVGTKNFGTAPQTAYDVSWSANGVLQETRTITRSLAANATDTVNFLWASPTAGAQTLRAWTALAGDESAANDTVAFNTTVTVGIDLGTTAISFSAPPKENIVDTVVVRVRNFGSLAAASYSVSWSLDGSPQETKNVSTPLLSNGTDSVKFVWASPVGGVRALKAWTTLTGDAAPLNDTTATSVTVTVPPPPAYVWSEGFNAAAFPPEGWEINNVDGQVQTWIRSTTAPIFGAASASVLFESSTSRNDDWLITRRTLANLKSRVSFYAKRTQVGPQFWADTVRVKVSTTGTAPANFTDLIGKVLPSTVAAGQRYEFPLGQYNAQQIYIAFHYNELDEGRLVIDSVATDTLGVAVPVELASFVATPAEGGVTLRWTTASEKNNAGFSIERSFDNVSYAQLAFIEGAGTTTEAKGYSFSDKVSQKAFYRLKQTDFDGTFQYSPVVESSPAVPKKFSLMQNYPNPFNPQTTIVYQLPRAVEVSLKVFDMLGREVTTLVNSRQEAGSYTAKFDASRLASGIYFYRLQAADFIQTRKMLLVK